MYSYIFYYPQRVLLFAFKTTIIKNSMKPLLNKGRSLVKISEMRTITKALPLFFSSLKNSILPANLRVLGVYGPEVECEIVKAARGKIGSWSQRSPALGGELQ